MPVIAKFYGIVIRLLCIRPIGARLHAFYGDSELVITLPTLRIIQDDAPPGVRALVLAWARRHHHELLADTQLLLRGERPLAIAA
jgi:hypothetical protein